MIIRNKNVDTLKLRITGGFFNPLIGDAPTTLAEIITLLTSKLLFSLLKNADSDK